MKSIAFLALSTMASAAMAVLPVGSGDIIINGASTQTANLAGTVMVNTAFANTRASQNLATNFGTVRVNGAATSEQTVTAGAGVVLLNTAFIAGDEALQNLSSNAGGATLGLGVRISGDSDQATTLNLAAAINTAVGGNAKAAQAMSSNVGDVVIGAAGTSNQTTSMTLMAVGNTAAGANAKAAQNTASNFAVTY